MRTREDWRRAVLRASTITDSTRVLLLYLADHMHPDRKVSVMRSQIAQALDRSERRITERTSAAVEAGLLVVVTPGYRGHTPVYQGTFPDPERVTPVRALTEQKGRRSAAPFEAAPVRALTTQERATHGGPTTTRADLPVSGYDRNVSNDEEAARA